MEEIKQQQQQQQQQQTSTDLSNQYSKGLLSDKVILEHMKRGSVIISPFQREFLSSCSYDVTLGPFFFREQDSKSLTIYNPYSEGMVKKIWGSYQTAEKYSEWLKSSNGMTLDNVHLDDMIIWVRAGESILAHTNEFIGGALTVNSMMHCRSSLGRNFIEVCKCASLGEIGYHSRWTMEITNNSVHHTIPLIVGRRIAQIVFFDTDGTIKETSYEGKYQQGYNGDINQLKDKWHPNDMLPKMFNDKEIKNRSLSTFSMDQYSNINRK
ncbi:dCTP deaminase [Cavenderia fasciculata]|uniref:dCTP deaminase n=1 Tax=Cavenderia fasciculata TaxID=261658 RepID=F4PM07_CACFS|nr:dCTP deaminase [Cavenderia fasciculata]EGG22710.1 dCTP deaminase [Cavenderia fasciculata]|eukprot:XP_004360561.1 dCTP deaminase [Cavenderia fasciculata]